jgi:soluble lytic murein transglycosylase-like protein
MNLGLWTFRTRSRNRCLPAATALLTAMLLAALCLPLQAQSPQPVQENGRVVWTNDNPELASTAPQAATEFVYWSNAEQRWKPVRPASKRALRSARAVAGEVSSYIASRPALNPADARDSGKTLPEGKLAVDDPNYSQAVGNRSVSTAQIDRCINEAAARHRVDPNLVRALIKVESNFNPRARSSKGAMGLMQLMPATARQYEVSNPFDAAQNVDAGVRHLKGLLQNFRGDVPLTLAAYNAGQGAVERNRGIPPYTETRNYVRRITGLMAGGTILGVQGLGIQGRGMQSSSIATASLPIEVRRDERGRLVISNTD